MSLAINLLLLLFSQNNIRAGYYNCTKIKQSESKLVHTYTQKSTTNHFVIGENGQTDTIDNAQAASLVERSTHTHNKVAHTIG